MTDGTDRGLDRDHGTGYRREVRDLSTGRCWRARLAAGGVPPAERFEEGQMPGNRGWSLYPNTNGTLQGKARYMDEKKRPGRLCAGRSHRGKRTCLKAVAWSKQHPAAHQSRRQGGAAVAGSGCSSQVVPHMAARVTVMTMTAWTEKRRMERGHGKGKALSEKESASNS